MPQPSTRHELQKARYLFEQGLAFLADGHLEEAEQKFSGSLVLAPGRVSVLVNLAAVRVRLARPLEALLAAEQALIEEPGSAEACFHRACALDLLQRHKEALEGYAKAGQTDEMGAHP